MQIKNGFVDITIICQLAEGKHYFNVNQKMLKWQPTRTTLGAFLLFVPQQNCRGNYTAQCVFRMHVASRRKTRQMGTANNFAEWKLKVQHGCSTTNPLKKEKENDCNHVLSHDIVFSAFHNQQLLYTALHCTYNDIGMKTIVGAINRHCIFMDYWN